MTAALPAGIAYRVINHDEFEYETWTTWLSDDENRCLGTFGHPSRRRSFVGGRAAARLVISDVTGSRPEESAITVLQSGAVKVSESELHLSIGHSGSFAAAVVSDRPVGLDIECRRTVPERLYERIASVDDQIVLNESGLPNAALACWTLKEAVLKGIGTGLRLAPKRLRLARSGDLYVIDTPEHGRWTATLMNDEHYLLSIAWLD